MTTTQNTTKHEFVVTIQVNAPDFGHALDSLTEALGECENSVEYSIQSGAMPRGPIVWTHSDYHLASCWLDCSREKCACECHRGYEGPNA